MSKFNMKAKSKTGLMSLHLEGLEYVYLDLDFANPSISL